MKHCSADCCVSVRRSLPDDVALLNISKERGGGGEGGEENEREEMNRKKERGQERIR